ncbi:TPA: hypothetical protein ACH3X2_011201 [Trebouxia sp. C0005]
MIPLCKTISWCWFPWKTKEYNAASKQALFHRQAGDGKWTLLTDDGLHSSSTAPGMGAWSPRVVAGSPQLGSQVVEVAVRADGGAA